MTVIPKFQSVKLCHRNTTSSGLNPCCLRYVEIKFDVWGVCRLSTAFSWLHPRGSANLAMINQWRCYLLCHSCASRPLCIQDLPRLSPGSASATAWSSSHEITNPGTLLSCHQGLSWGTIVFQQRFALNKEEERFGCSLRFTVAHRF
jgi:hypothetical protein